CLPGVTAAAVQCYEIALSPKESAAPPLILCRQRAAPRRLELRARLGQLLRTHGDDRRHQSRPDLGDRIVRRGRRRDRVGRGCGCFAVATCPVENGSPVSLPLSLAWRPTR